MYLIQNAVKKCITFRIVESIHPMNFIDILQNFIRGQLVLQIALCIYKPYDLNLMECASQNVVKRVQLN